MQSVNATEAQYGQRMGCGLKPHGYFRASLRDEACRRMPAELAKLQAVGFQPTDLPQSSLRDLDATLYRLRRKRPSPSNMPNPLRAVASEPGSGTTVRTCSATSCPCPGA